MYLKFKNQLRSVLDVHIYMYIVCEPCSGLPISSSLCSAGCTYLHKGCVSCIYPCPYMPKNSRNILWDTPFKVSPSIKKISCLIYYPIQRRTVDVVFHLSPQPETDSIIPWAVKWAKWNMEEMYKPVHWSPLSLAVIRGY
jgi:hypothetical protein